VKLYSLLYEWGFESIRKEQIKTLEEIHELRVFEEYVNLNQLNRIFSFSNFYKEKLEKYGTYQKAIQRISAQVTNGLVSNSLFLQGESGVRYEVYLVGQRPYKWKARREVMLDTDGESDYCDCCGHYAPFYDV
jgi:hypothetical protein